MANYSRKVGLFTILSMALTSIVNAQNIGVATSKGLFLKDTITVKSFNDPDIKGIACYTTKYKKGGSFLSSTNSSLSCRQVGPISGGLSDRASVFSQQKGFIFNKKTIVARYIDRVRKVVVYLSYTKSMGGKNSSHSLSVVPTKEWRNEN